MHVLRSQVHDEPAFGLHERAHDLAVELRVGRCDMSERAEIDLAHTAASCPTRLPVADHHQRITTRLPQAPGIPSHPFRDGPGCTRAAPSPAMKPLRTLIQAPTANWPQGRTHPPDLEQQCHSKCVTRRSWDVPGQPAAAVPYHVSAPHIEVEPVLPRCPERLRMGQVGQQKALYFNWFQGAEGG